MGAVHGASTELLMLLSSPSSLSLDLALSEQWLAVNTEDGEFCTVNYSRQF